MRRRDFITLLGSTAAWPLMARAQQSSIPVVGILSSSSLSAFTDLLGAFREGLKETGYIEGRNITIESRWAEGRFERLPELAAELVKRRVAGIGTTGGSATLAPNAVARSSSALIRSSSAAFIKSSCWPHTTKFLQFTIAASLSRPVASSATVRTCLMRTARSVCTPGGSSQEQSHPTCRSCSQPSSSL